MSPNLSDSWEGPDADTSLIDSTPNPLRPRDDFLSAIVVIAWRRSFYLRAQT
jgi:hypothetical protein